MTDLFTHTHTPRPRAPADAVVWMPVIGVILVRSPRDGEGLDVVVRRGITYMI